MVEFTSENTGPGPDRRTSIGPSAVRSSGSTSFVRSTSSSAEPPTWATTSADRPSALRSGGTLPADQ